MSDTRQQFAQFNVVASYPDLEHARVAITALERKGIEAGDISLVGPAVDEAKAPASGDEQLEQDMETSGEVGKRAVAGGAAGTVAGALLGAAAFAIPGVGPAIGGGILAAALGGGLAGGAVGGFWGGASGLPVNEQWEETFARVGEGGACVAVHTDDEGELQTALAALEGTHADGMFRFGPDGEPVTD